MPGSEKGGGKAKFLLELGFEQGTAQVQQNKDPFLLSSTEQAQPDPFC